MSQETDRFHQKALAAVKFLWNTYLITRDEEEFARVFSFVTDDLVFIGTGRHELYQGVVSVMRRVAQEQRDASHVDFEVVDEWYDLQTVTDDVCVVYGTFWVREKTGEHRRIVADMDTRFSVVCRREGDGVLLCHLHHSVPNIDQQPGEYYPRSVTQRANEALERYAILEKRASMDALTGLRNRAWTESRVAEHLRGSRPGGAFFMLDLDNFKSVNDTLGHLAGDQVLRNFAAILTEALVEANPRNADASDGAVAGRMGGDEFAVLLPNVSSPEEAEAFARSVVERFGRYAEQEVGVPGLSCSVGVAMVPKEGCLFREIYGRADRSLYEKKRNSRARRSQNVRRPDGADREPTDL